MLPPECRRTRALIPNVGYRPYTTSRRACPECSAPWLGVLEAVLSSRSWIILLTSREVQCLHRFDIVIADVGQRVGNSTVPKGDHQVPHGIFDGVPWHEAQLAFDLLRGDVI